MAIETGNLDTINRAQPERRGWFLGNFISESSLLHSQECEAKWVRFSKGDYKDSGMTTERPVRTAVILVSGSWKLKFASGNETLLSKPADYVVFDNEPHESEALEDSHVFAIRWYPHE